MESSLYIHIPFCRQKCDYCDFFSVGESGRREKSNEVSGKYIEAVVNEAKFYAEFYDIKNWSSIYLGGGTPGILSEKQLFDLITGVKNAVKNQTECETTVEVNPENITEEKIKILEKAGANRISMGIQALDDKALKKVNRKSDVKTILNALNLLEKFWNGRLSVDFISGLPGQTYKSFENQFAILDDFKKIDHVSLYTLTVEENTPLAKKIDSGEILFSSEKADKMWIKGRNILEKKGFLQYEISNFSRPGFESAHNSSYWRQKNYIGAGSGAVGTLYDFNKMEAARWTNTLSIPGYVNFWTDNEKLKNLAFESAISKKGNAKNLEPDLFFQNLPRKIEKLDGETLEFEFLMTGFRLLSGISSNEYSARFGKSLEERIGAQDGIFSKWRKLRLAKVINSKEHGGGKVFALNKRGILLLNRFLEELL